MDKPYKPLCLAHNEAKKEIFDAITKTINEHTLPLFLAEIIVKEALDKIKDGAQTERAMAQQLYEQQIKEYEAETEGSENE